MYYTSVICFPTNIEDIILSSESILTYIYTIKIYILIHLYCIHINHIP